MLIAAHPRHSGTRRRRGPGIHTPQRCGVWIPGSLAALAPRNDVDERTQAMNVATSIGKVDYDGLIPNNVGLGQDERVKRALEKWHPGYIDWWKDMGPDGFQESLVYLRTAVSVDPKGWAKFDYVKM